MERVSDFEVNVQGGQWKGKGLPKEQIKVRETTQQVPQESLSLSRICVVGLSKGLMEARMQT